MGVGEMKRTQCRFDQTEEGFPVSVYFFKTVGLSKKFIGSSLTPRRHGSSGPLEVHLLSFSDLLEWTCDLIVIRATPFPKLFHVDDIVILPTFQWSLSPLSGLYLLVIVPPFHFLHNFIMVLNVIRRWFALLHLLRNAFQSQVVPDADGSEKVAKTTQQASSWVPLLLPTLARERTFQNMIGIHFWYWCIVVLWPGRRHFYVFSVFQSAFFKRVCFFWRKKKIFLSLGRECHTKGWKRDEKGPKKNFNFFSLHVPMWSEFTVHLHV